MALLAVSQVDVKSFILSLLKQANMSGSALESKMVDREKKKKKKSSVVAALVVVVYHRHDVDHVFTSRRHGLVVVHLRL